MTGDPRNVDAADVVFAAAGGAQFAAPLTVTARAQVADLPLERDSRGAIALNTANLQQLAAARVVQFNPASGTYTLNAELMQPSAKAAAFAFTPAADGLWTANPIDGALTLALSPVREQTSVESAIRAQAAIPSSEVENPYLKSQAAKLTILLQELAAILGRAAQFDNASVLKTFDRAIANADAKASAIAASFAAENQRLRGDIAAAELLIAASITSLAMQGGALAGGKWGKLLLDPTGPIGGLVTRTMQGSAEIQRSQTAMKSNRNLSAAKQHESDADLESTLISHTLQAERARAAQRDERFQQLLDLIANLSRTRVEQQRALFRG